MTHAAPTQRPSLRRRRGRSSEGASIAIVNDGGNLMYIERLQPTFPMGTTISTEKARTAALFQKPTKILEEAIVSAGALTGKTNATN